MDSRTLCGIVVVSIFFIWLVFAIGWAVVKTLSELFGCDDGDSSDSE